MPDEHRTIILSISGTLISAIIVLVGTLIFDGGTFNFLYFESYVLPEIISAFALSVFLVLMLVDKKMIARAAKVKTTPKP